MNTNRKIALIVGLLFLISYAGVFVGAAVVGLTLDAPNYLTDAYPNRHGFRLKLFRRKTKQPHPNPPQREGAVTGDRVWKALSQEAQNICLS